MSDISHDCYLNWNAHDAVLGKGMGCNFEDEMGGAGFGDFFNAMVESLWVDGGHVFDLFDEAVFIAVFNARSTPGDGSHEASFDASMI